MKSLLKRRLMPLSIQGALTSPKPKQQQKHPQPTNPSSPQPQNSRDNKAQDPQPLRRLCLAFSMPR